MSDTGLIRDEAEIHAHVSRVEVIAQLEAASPSTFNINIITTSNIIIVIKHAHVSRLKVIAQLEATLLGDPSLLLTGHQRSRLVLTIHSFRT